MTLATIFTCAAMAAIGTLVFVLGPLCFEPVSSFQPELLRTARRATAATTPSGHDSRFRRRYCFFHKRYDCHRASGSMRTGSALGQQKEEHRVQGQVQGQEEPILELESSRNLLDSPSPEQQPQEQEQQRPWTTAMVDYSGANEYIEAHYGRHPSLQTTLWKHTAATPAAPYFSSGNQPNNPDTSTRSDVVEERIYNGRQVMPIQMTRALNTNSSTNRDTFIAGHANNNRNHRSENNASRAACHRTTMERYGMTLVHSPTAVRNWMDPREIQDSYVRELEALLPCLFSSEIRMHCFWNPMLRGEALELSPPRNDKGNDKDDDDDDDNDNDNDNEAVPDIPTANVASMVHIDTDIGAYESLDEFLAIVEANRVPRGTATTTTTTTTPFDRARWASSILEDRKRFAVVNFWRNTHPDLPVTMSNRPLAILSTHYSDDDRTNHAATDTDRILPAFPYVRPDTERSKWYCFPNMTNDELLIFYQYDRAVKQPSDLWHCAISQVPAAKNADGAGPRQRAPETNTTTTPRESFDIRALVVFDEAVPPDEDRFHPGRVRPVLSFEESGCFCDEQGLARTNKEEP